MYLVNTEFILLMRTITTNLLAYAFLYSVLILQKEWIVLKNLLNNLNIKDIFW